MVAIIIIYIHVDLNILDKYTINLLKYAVGQTIFKHSTCYINITSRLGCANTKLYFIIGTTCSFRYFQHHPVACRIQKHATGRGPKLVCFVIFCTSLSFGHGGNCACDDRFPSKEIPRDDRDDDDRKDTTTTIFAHRLPTPADSST